MAATALQVLQLRRMTGLTGTAETDYTDSQLETYIEAHPLLDELGEEPYTIDSSTTPPTQEANDAWIPTYDLNAAAADIWQERASVLAARFDFSADGGNYSRSQSYEQYMKQARYYNSRRSAHVCQSFQWPPENANATVPDWVGNLPEAD